MQLSFSKYQGTGNDFIMLNNLKGEYNTLDIKNIQFLCDRKRGIGADGLIKLSKQNDVDFLVEYYNADGSQSFCGNGARCSVAFANSIGIINDSARFSAIDGIHTAQINNGIVRLEMLPVSTIHKIDQDYFLDTGSPHYVHLIAEEKAFDIVEYGKSIRYSPEYKQQGVNVNTIHKNSDNSIFVQTYERGVEDETLSCGTGVTACALVWMELHKDLDKVNVSTKGGNLLIEAKRDEKGFREIWLSGPAKKVFDGSIDIEL